MKNKIPCPICRSVKYLKDSLGFYVCENGHQALFHRIEDDEEAVISSKTITRGHRVTSDGKRVGGHVKLPFFVIPKVTDPKKSAFLDAEIMQFGLMHFIPHFVETFGITDPDRFKEIVLDLWMLYITSTGIELAPDDHSIDCLERGDLISPASGFDMAPKSSGSKAPSADELLKQDVSTDVQELKMRQLGLLHSDSDESDDENYEFLEEQQAVEDALQAEMDEDVLADQEVNEGDDTSAKPSSKSETVKVTGVSHADIYPIRVKRLHPALHEYGRTSRHAMKSVSEFLPPEAVYIIPLLACYWLNMPITPKMVEDAIRDGDLPARTWYEETVPLFLRKRFLQTKYMQNRQLLPSAKSIESLAHQFMYVYWDRFNIHFPKLNWVILLPKWLSDLRLPPCIFPLVHELVHSLRISFTFAHHRYAYYFYAKHPKMPRSSFSVLAACVFFVLKILYGLSKEPFSLDNWSGTSFENVAKQLPLLRTWILYFSLYLGPSSLISNDSRVVPQHWIQATNGNTAESTDFGARVAEKQRQLYFEQLNKRFPRHPYGEFGRAMDKLGVEFIGVHQAKRQVADAADNLYNALLNSELDCNSATAKADNVYSYFMYELADVVGGYHRDYILVGKIIARVTGVHLHDLFSALHHIERVLLRAEKARDTGLIRAGRSKIVAHWKHKFIYKKS